MNYKLGCRLDYVVEQSSTFLFHLSVDQNEHQLVEDEQLHFEPDVACEVLSTPRGRVHRVRVPAGPLSLRYTASGTQLAEIQPATGIGEVPAIELPAHVLEYVYPSRYCESDLCIDVAHREFGSLERGYGRVLAICRWIQQRLTYVSFSSGPSTSAKQTLDTGRGVCRDYAHLGIAFCRALNIPARFVAAYAPGLQPPDFHACFEAYLDHRWWLFDPTFMVRRDGIVRIGTGRDAADVSFATILGWVKFGEMSVHMDVTGMSAEEPSDDEAMTIAAAVPQEIEAR
jgi:transglutaminase-like putative cysteine protease